MVSVAGPDPAAGAVREPMFRAIAVLRVVLLVYALGLGWFDRDDVVRPAAALAVYAGMTLWTAVSLWAYAAARRRTPVLLVADLAVAVAAILLSPLARGADLRATVPGFWVLAVVLVWAVCWGWPGGLGSAVAVTGCDVLVRTHLSQTNYGNIFLLVVGGAVVGFLTGLLTDMARARDQAERAAAAAEERARLARVVHDGVLQVLSLVQRRGAEIGGATADLGRLAGEQEMALRSLVQAQHAAEAGAPPGRASADLGAGLAALGARPSPRTQVAVPGEPVLVDAALAEEVLALVRACLHNVSDHVGEQATAWVLLEDVGAEIVVSVRDDGDGITPERLEEAVASGRLGVSESIRGRARDLGGTAALTTAPGRGTEWELTIPKPTRSTVSTRVDEVDEVDESEAALNEDASRVGTEPGETREIRVMVVDDHPMWRENVARDLEEAGLRVVATAATGTEALARFPAARPSVVVLDLQIPEPDGVEVTARMVEQDPSVRVLILSASGEQSDVLEAVKAGATGYLVKSASRAELVSALTRVARGDTVFTPGLAGLVLGEYRRLSQAPARRSEPEIPVLSVRETEVLRMVAKGLAYRDIADRLVLSHRTVQNHVQNTLRKLQLHNRVQLVRYAIEQGLDDELE